MILGCGNFGGIGSSPAFFGQGESKEEAFAIMDAAWDAGITTFDTADAYGGGSSETFIGEWLRSRRPDGIVLSTKTFNPMDEGADHGLAPARVGGRSRAASGGWASTASTSSSPTPGTRTSRSPRRPARSKSLWPKERSARTGSRTSTARSLREAVAAGSFGWVQNSYSLLDRGVEEDVLPLCEELGLGFTPFSPLAGGWLTGKYRRGAAVPAGSRMTMRPEPYEHLRDDAIYDRLERLEELGDPATLALAWLLGDPRVTAVDRRPAPPGASLAGPCRTRTPLRHDELSALFS